ncbi:ABC transporter permease [Kitasatospora sp. NPDC059827]|uniref:ABC transporter permease n=1 Tax=Kitasatospora sp. NPDC059827 TaxID=3346964 RepID=UPI00364F2241
MRTRGWGLRGQLLRTGLAAGRRAEAGKVRFVALLGATAALAAALLTAAAGYATYEGREARQTARAPVLAVNDSGRPATARWGAAFDSVGGRQFSIVYLEPLTPDAPLPPGLARWPAPGEAVLSPALRADGASESIADRYGTVVGTIGAEGLAAPGERLAYIRPTAVLAPDARRMDGITGYGQSDWNDFFGDPIFIGKQWLFQLGVAGLLVLPALVLTVVAVRSGAVARDRRTAVVSALGGSRRDTAWIALGEAVVPLAAGAAVTAAASAGALVRDWHIPVVSYQLAAADLRDHAWLLLSAWLLSTVAVAGAVTVTGSVSARPSRAAKRSRRVRPTATGPRRSTTRCAALCPVMLLVAVRGPDYVDPQTALAGLVHYAGVIGTLATLPAVIGLAAAAAGRCLTRCGRRLGSPGTLIGGRHMAVHPSAATRVVAGVVVAVGLIIQIQMWYTAGSAPAVQAKAIHQRFGDTMLQFRPVNTPTPDRISAFRTRLPANASPVTLTDPGGDTPGGLLIRGSCDALTSLELPCTAEPVAVPPTAGDRRARMLMSFYSYSGRTPRAQAGEPGITNAGSTTVLISTDGRDLPTARIKNAAFHTLPQGAEVSTVGGEWLIGTNTIADQARWIPLLGAVAITVLAAAVGISGLTEFLRFGTVLAPTTVLTGTPGVYAVAAAWNVLLPMALAGLAGDAVGAWLAISRPVGGTELSTTTLAFCALATVALATVLWVWGTVSSTRQGRTWTPGKD